MRPYTLIVPASGFVEFGAVGDYVRLKSATVSITIENPDGSDKAVFEEGDAAHFRPFKALRVTHDEASDQTVIVYVGQGTSMDSAKIGGSLQITPTQSSAGSQAAATVGVASAQLLAANSNRKFLLIQNQNATGIIYLNLFGAAAVIGAGFALEPGESIKLDGTWMPTAQINAIGSVAGIAAFVVEGQ